MLLSSIFEKYALRPYDNKVYNRITKQYETNPQIASLLQSFRQVPSRSQPGQMVFLTTDDRRRRIRDLFINKLQGGTSEQKEAGSSNQYRLMSFNIMNRHTVNTGNNKSSGINLHGFQESTVINDQWRIDRAEKLLEVIFRNKPDIVLLQEVTFDIENWKIKDKIWKKKIYQHTLVSNKFLRGNKCRRRIQTKLKLALAKRIKLLENKEDNAELIIKIDKLIARLNTIHVDKMFDSFKHADDDPQLTKELDMDIDTEYSDGCTILYNPAKFDNIYEYGDCIGAISKANIIDDEIEQDTAAGSCCSIAVLKDLVTSAKVYVINIHNKMGWGQKFSVTENAKYLINFLKEKLFNQYQFDPTTDKLILGGDFNSGDREWSFNKEKAQYERSAVKRIPSPRADWNEYLTIIYSGLRDFGVPHVSELGVHNPKMTSLACYAGYGYQDDHMLTYGLRENKTNINHEENNNLSMLSVMCPNPDKQTQIREFLIQNQGLIGQGKDQQGKESEDVPESKEPDKDFINKIYSGLFEGRLAPLEKELKESIIIQKQLEDNLLEVQKNIKKTSVELGQFYNDILTRTENNQKLMDTDQIYSDHKPIIFDVYA